MRAPSSPQSEEEKKKKNSSDECTQFRNEKSLSNAIKNFLCKIKFVLNHTEGLRFWEEGMFSQRSLSHNYPVLGCVELYKYVCA